MGTFPIRMGQRTGIVDDARHGAEDGPDRVKAS